MFLRRHKPDKVSPPFFSLADAEPGVAQLIEVLLQLKNY